MQDLRSYLKMQQNFLIRANSFIQRAGIVALSNEGDEAVERMRRVYDKRRKLMVELMREVGFGIPVMPQGAFYVFADASRWTDDRVDDRICGDGGRTSGKMGTMDQGFLIVLDPRRVLEQYEVSPTALRSYASSEENSREAARGLGEYLGRKV